MLEVLSNLVSLLAAVWQLVISVAALILPWTPLIGWLAFWLFAVDWVKLRAVMLQGAWIAVLFFGFMAILIWGVIAPPDDGFHYFFGLTLSNFVGKTVYVTALITIMYLCGSVQLSGACGSWASFPEPEPEESHHGHDDHGHDSHGHAPAVAIHAHH
ncbi:MAG: hypothetical protein QM756_14940 [Polyangiaceae bacterium]